MILVVFGAGASYDSAPDFPTPGSEGYMPSEEEEYRPPLANDLFELRGHFSDILEKYSDCHPIVPLLRPDGRSSIEETLQRLQAETDEDPIRFRQMAAVRFYLQEVISECTRGWWPATRGITNYTTLLDQLRRCQPTMGTPTCLVTFNYDTLLEKSLQSLGITISKIDDYVTSNEFKVFKVHGSANWAHAIKTPGHVAVNDKKHTIQQLIEHAASIEPEDRFEVTKDIPSWRLGKKRAMPGIAIPLERGKTFECPQKHLAQLEELLPNVRGLLIIGWRGVEEHFLELLRRTLGTIVRKCLVVSGSANDAQQIARHLINNGGVPITEDVFAGSGFTEFARSRKVEEFFEDSRFLR